MIVGRRYKWVYMKDTENLKTYFTLFYEMINKVLDRLNNYLAINKRD